MLSGAHIINVFLMFSCTFLLQLLASASYDNKVCIYKEEDDDWECRATLEGHESTVWSLTFDPEGQRLASCSADRTVKIWKESTPGDGESVRISKQFLHTVLLYIAILNSKSLVGSAVMVILSQVHQMSPGSVCVPCLDSMGEQYMMLHGKMHCVNFKS